VKGPLFDWGLTRIVVIRPPLREALVFSSPLTFKEFIRNLRIEKIVTTS